ncbi:MAG: RHS repeat protein [Chloracidobacterium sp.]|nr:RHS repeat protein [Chloracidobacterium sp.]
MDATLPNQQTAYEYDGNDNLSKVTQSDGTTTQERKFMYDSLSRLKAERQVEAIPTLALDGTHGTADPSKWTKVLKYDTHGLLTDGWDARGVHTQMSYDGLNRVLGVTYSGENGYKTPAVSYTYDQARTGFFNAGALTKVETAQGDATLNPDAPATKTEFDYDLMGRVSKHRQWIGTQQYDLEYGYNLAGQLTSEKYPSGKIVTMGYDAKGRMASVSDQSRTYLSGLVYAGKGGSISAMNFGNGTAETFGLNDRFQIETQELKKGSATLQKYNYNYGQIDVSNGNIAANSNNGQLAKVESWIGTAKQWEQRFGYDSIGRLKESSEIRGADLSLTYKQVFDYDRFGNMYRKSANNNRTVR